MIHIVTLAQSLVHKQTIFFILSRCGVANFKMNGDANVMYYLKPPYTISNNIELPTNMYKLAKIQSVGGNEFNPLLDIQDKVNTILKASDVVLLEKRWENVLMQLRDMKKIIAEIKLANSFGPINAPVHKPKALGPNKLNLFEGAVINASPSTPPYSLLLLRKLFQDVVNINITCHTHSTVSPSAAVEITQEFSSKPSLSNASTTLNVTLIWKEGLLDTQLVINPWKNTTIMGEVNILRYLARLGLESLNYDESNDSIYNTDSVLDLSHRLVHVKTAKEKASIIKNLNAKLGKNLYFGGNEMSICDISVWSALKQTNLVTPQDLPQNVAKWFVRFNDIS